MEEMWLARDENNALILHKNKPLKSKFARKWIWGGQWIFIPNDCFPEVQWTDEEPTKVKLIIER